MIPTIRTDWLKYARADAPAMHQQVPTAPCSTPTTQLYRQPRSAHHHTQTMSVGHVHQSVISMVAFINKGTATMASHGRLRLHEMMYRRLLNKRPTMMTGSDSAMRSRHVIVDGVLGGPDCVRVTHGEMFI